MPNILSRHVTGRALARLRAGLCALPTSLALLALAAAPAAAQAAGPASAVSCPERLRTMAATPADPGQIAGFVPVFRGTTGSQTFLQDIAIHAGPADAGAPLKGQAEGRKKITWTLDGTAEVVASCIYEGGVSLTRPMGRPKSCTAEVQRSKDKGSDGGWGMERASLRCR